MVRSKVKAQRVKDAEKITGAIMRALSQYIMVERLEAMSLTDYMDLEEKIRVEVEAVL